MPFFYDENGEWCIDCMKLNSSISEQLNGYLAELPILERSTLDNTISRVGLEPSAPHAQQFLHFNDFF